ncbi:hypothetical protein ACQ4PT_047753 [Festuca glaucescens]
MAAAGSSRFAVTCGLMRQYMRDQQQGGAAPRPPAVSLLLSPPSEETDARTMQLFPASPPSLPQPPEAQRTTAPLTIIYDGRVVVFDDFPAEKAKALMQLAGSESSPPEAAKKVAAASVVPEAAALSDLPIARKASLQRFLQKRKHRISTNDPYQKATPEKDAGVKAPVKDDDPASWLGL